MAIFAAMVERVDQGVGAPRPDTDIDPLIEAQKPYRFDFLGPIALGQEISEDIGISVDLILDEDLKPGIAARARDEAVLV